MDTRRTVLTAQHVMQKAVFVLRHDAQVFDAVDDLVQRGFTGAPVLQDGRLVGIFSERDALTAVATAHYEDEPPGTVAQHMRREFPVCCAGTDIYEMASVFRNHPVHRVPVVDAERRLLGIVSRGDVLRGLRVMFPHRPKNNYEKLQEHMSLRLGS
jgi:CBS domain-containing protein